jgi:hypothetical protein
MKNVILAAFALGWHANLQCRSRDAPEVCDWRQPHYLVRLRGFARWRIVRRRNLYGRISAQVNLKPVQARYQGSQPSAESGSLHRRLLDPVVADSGTRRTTPLAADTHFVDVLQEVGRIFIDAIRARTLEFVLAVAARQETNAKGAGALRS